jgi:L-asparaginase/Glu-tRNA(Gln) amidotransferase subunit D
MTAMGGPIELQGIRLRNHQPWKARILLRLALTRTAESDEIQRLFDLY